MEQEKILQIFQETDGILKGHFQLASGRHSDTYMQCAKLFMYPDKSALLCGELAKELRDIPVDFVASPAVGGVIMGYQMAACLNKPNIFFERVNGEMTLRRGFEVVKGARYLVVEDVVTTGGSVREVISLIEAAGGIVPVVASVVDRSNGKVDFGREYRALLSMEVISYEPDECPLCKAGMGAPVKP
ncbi:MAG: orotate phosphoribosyltransferase, partial [Clostridia bacterium]|nr:orotate phosphoribosyltransferase [Clostridia bacterium]